MVLFGKLHGVAERLPAGDDRDLVDGIGALEHVADEGVTALVVGDDLALPGRNHAALALGAGDHALHGLLDLEHADRVLVEARGEKRRLVHEVRQVGTRETGRELGDARDVHVVCQRLVRGVHGEDLLAAGHVGTIHGHATVKAAGAEKCGVEDVRAVGGGDHDDGGVVLEAVHLDEQLVQGLLALVMSAAQTGAALTADRIDLVDEDDAGGGLLGLLEEVTHARGADAHEHLDEVGAGDREERHARLARHGLGQERLARARRADEQHAMGNLRAHLLVALGFSQEVADLLELLDGLVDAGHVGELDLWSLLLGGERLRLSELHGATVLIGHATHVVDEDGHEEDGGHHRDENRLEDARGRGVNREGDVGVLGHELVERVGSHIDGLVLHERVGVALVVLGLPVGARDAAVLRLERDGGDAAVLHGGNELVGGERVHLGVGRKRVDPHREEQVCHDGDHDERGDEPRPLGIGLVITVAGRAEVVEWILVGHGVRLLAERHTRTAVVRARLLGIDPRLEHADIGQVAVALGVVETIAHDELVGHVGAHVVRLDGRRVTGDVLDGEGHDAHRVGAATLEHLHEIAERETGVEDVLRDDDVSSLDLGVEILDDADDARALDAVTVARDSHEVHGTGHADRAHEVRREDEGAAENRYDERVLSGVVAADLGS